MKEITKERIDEVVDKVGAQISRNICKEYAKLLTQSEYDAREQPGREVLGIRLAQNNCTEAMKEVLYELLVG